MSEHSARGSGVQSTSNRRRAIVPQPEQLQQQLQHGTPSGADDWWLVSRATRTGSNSNGGSRKKVASQTRKVTVKMYTSSSLLESARQTLCQCQSAVGPLPASDEVHRQLALLMDEASTDAQFVQKCRENWHEFAQWNAVLYRRQHTCTDARHSGAELSEACSELLCEYEFEDGDLRVVLFECGLYADPAQDDDLS